jgi:NAD(P)H-nitrite reductase large subunit
VKEKDVFFHPAEFYKSLGVEVVTDKEITRINAVRRRIFLEERRQFEYDGLVLTDAPQLAFADIKGTRRSGVFHLARLETVKSLIRFLPFTETALLEVSGWSGIRTALALKALGKEVVIVTRGNALLEGVITAEGAETLMCLLDKRGLRVVLASGIDDIIGENEVRAVRLRTGKVMACEMVVVEAVAPDLRFMESEGAEPGRVRMVHDLMSSRESSEYLGDAAARALCGESVPEGAGMTGDAGALATLFTAEEIEMSTLTAVNI